MAKSMPFEACMFCAQVPCICGKKSKPAKKAAKPRKVAIVEAPVLAAPKPPEQVVPAVKRSFKAREVGRDPNLDQAVRNLMTGGILHSDEIKANQDLIDVPDDVRERLENWRSRNGGVA